MAVGSHYSGEAGRQYATVQRGAYDVSGRLNRPKFAREVTPTDVVVDFGCGDGGLLAGLDAGRRIGIEPNPSTRELARARGFDDLLPTLTEVDSASVDVVVSNHALEHVVDPAAALQEVLRVLRPGGRLVLWLPLDDWRTQRDLQAPDADHHLFTWTPRLLSNLLQELGFDVDEVAVITEAFPPHADRLQRMVGERGFAAACRMWSVLRRRRQVMARAYRPRTIP